MQNLKNQQKKFRHCSTRTELPVVRHIMKTARAHAETTCTILEQEITEETEVFYPSPFTLFPPVQICRSFGMQHGRCRLHSVMMLQSRISKDFVLATWRLGSSTKTKTKQNEAISKTQNPHFRPRQRGFRSEHEKTPAPNEPKTACSVHHRWNGIGAVTIEIGARPKSERGCLAHIIHRTHHGDTEAQRIRIKENHD